MKNVQISFEENLLESIDSIASSSQLSRSAIVREALRNWIKQREIQKFEREWIRKLKEHPQDLVNSKAWMEIEQWEER
jgi:metal-responsive CopG/Arc/MetJ family transcriptional regulator